MAAVSGQLDEPDDERREAVLFRLLGLRPRSFLSALGHPGIVFGRAAPRRHTGGLASHPVRHVRQMLARRLAGEDDSNTHARHRAHFNLRK